jgi:hypothetical protein
MLILKHRFHDRDDGLQHCMVCNGGEGSLPTNCPGRRMTAAEGQQVFEGALDFRGSGWFSASNFVVKPSRNEP